MKNTNYRKGAVKGFKDDFTNRKTLTRKHEKTNRHKAKIACHNMVKEV